MDISEFRKRTVESILARQDEHFRWAFDEQSARQRPELTYYWPKYKASLWTLLLLADLRAPINNRQIYQSYDLIVEHFYDEIYQIFSLGERGHFPIPCLNGNMLYLHFYLQRPYTQKIDGIVEFFNTCQRFDDGGFKTPRAFPFLSNTSCYGQHTCYWGIVKLFKGLSSIPEAQRTNHARRLIGNCIEFILMHQVLYRSHAPDQIIRPGIDLLTFPHLWWDDFLEILWLLAREGVHDPRMRRALELLRQKRQADGSWQLEHPVPNLIIPVGKKNGANAFITEKAGEVLEYYG
jgi:hypothetical protein